MSNYNSTLQSNNTDLQAILDSINALPEAGGVDLPELTNEGTAADLLSGKELIDGEGNKVTGTFSIDSELTTQDDLIAQIQAAVDSLPEVSGSSGNNSGEIETVEITCSGWPEPGSTIIYVDGTMTFQQQPIKRNAVYSIMKNSIFAVTNWSYAVFSGIQQIAGSVPCRIFLAVNTPGGNIN